MDAQLDERKVTILKAIIKTYLETGEPVGSRTISKYSELKLSSATIRNEMSDLEEWFDSLLQEYRKWSDADIAWKKLRQDSIHSLSFPFPYREGQKELVTHVYDLPQQKTVYRSTDRGG